MSGQAGRMTTPKTGVCRKSFLTNVRRSPRLINKATNLQDSNARKCINLDVCEEQITVLEKCLTQPSVGDSHFDVEDTDFWKQASAHTSQIEERFHFDQYDNVQLPNEEPDECNPVDDPLCHGDDGLSDADDNDALNDMEFISRWYKGEIQHHDEDSDHEDVPNDVTDYENSSLEGIVDIDDVWPPPNLRESIVENNWLQEICSIEDDLFPNKSPPEVLTDVLEVGMSFEDRDAFKKQLRTYAILNKFQYKLTQADKTRVRAECKMKVSQDYQFLATARVIPRTQTFTIRKLRLDHTCTGLDVTRNPSCNSDWISDYFYKRLKSASVVPKPQEIINEIWANFGIDLPYWVGWRARDKVLEKMNGNYDTSYKLVPSLCQMITLENPGSIASYSFDKNNHTFRSLCISFNNQIEGFISGCRPVICLDGCHLKGRYGGCLMSATALDAQNGLYPLAIFICRNECYDNWFMFLRLLRPRITNHASKLSFISDRQKGLKESVVELSPTSQHRFCFRHLYKNFKNHHKGKNLQTMVWNAASSYKEKHFWDHMEKLMEKDVDAFTYMMEEDHTSWSRAWFSKDSCCEHLSNNFSESFNNMISKLRDKPICTIVSMYGHLVMKFHYKRTQAAKSWDDGSLVPKGLKLIDNMKEKLGEFDIKPAEEHRLYEVTSKHKTIFTVNVVDKTCSCVQWQLRGFPCQHAVCVLVKFRPNWVEYCNHYYTVDAYRTTYANVLHPFRDIRDWEKPLVKVLPPILMRKPGRPSSNRKKSWTEGVTKKKKTCSICKTPGHNKKNCPGGKVGSNPKKKNDRTEVDGGTLAQSSYSSTIKQQRNKAKGNSETTYAPTTSTQRARFNIGGMGMGRGGRTN